MEYQRFFIQQFTYDGTTYTAGDVVDTFETFGVVCNSFPFKQFPEAKDIEEEDYPGTDGMEVFIPEHAYLKDYEVEGVFGINGELSVIRPQITSFLKFLYGRNTNGSARLAIYDEHSQTGRKDIRVVSVDNDLWWNDQSDDEKIGMFKVKFHVYDPSTEVTPSFDANNQITALTWQ